MHTGLDQELRLQRRSVPLLGAMGLFQSCCKQSHTRNLQRSVYELEFCCRQLNWERGKHGPASSRLAGMQRHHFYCYWANWPVSLLIAYTGKAVCRPSTDFKEEVSSAERHMFGGILRSAGLATTALARTAGREQLTALPYLHSCIR